MIVKTGDMLQYIKERSKIKPNSTYSHLLFDAKHLYPFSTTTKIISSSCKNITTKPY